MLEIRFIDVQTDKVNYAIRDVSLIRYITPSEIGFTYLSGRNSSASFVHTEKMEIVHTMEPRNG